MEREHQSRTRATERRSIEIQIRRYLPEEAAEPSWESFRVPVHDEWMVLDALNHVKDELDGSLAYRWACRMGVCGSCGMMVDGEPVLTCATYLADLLPGPVRIEPLASFPVIRDLVVDTGSFVDKLASAKPWLIRDEEKPLDEGEYLQTPEELARYKPYSMCINCMLCYAACPISELEPDFTGPAALALAQRYNLDSRDQGAEQRLDALSQDHGIWSCTFVGECSAVCPKGVDPAGAIQRYKLQAATAWVRAKARALLTPWGER
jgi:fumarate reductase iron-sulfur subunit